MANIRFNARHGLSVGSTPIDVIDSNGLIVGASIPGLDAAKITTGTIDAARLPSYVDDVVEAASLAALPPTGETGKIYVALDTNKTYRWSGSAYVYITSGAVDSVAGKTGVVALAATDVGLGNVENKSSATIRSEITSSNVTTALGFTPYNSTNPSGYTTNLGTVTGVTGTAPVVSSGGTSPAISMAAASSGVNGYMTGVYATKLDGIAAGATNVTNTNQLTNGAGFITGITSGNVTTALGFTPYNSTNPSGYITGITSGNVTTALGFTPYNNTNPSGYITSSGSISGNAATATTASNSSALNGLSKIQLWNNSGNNHSTYLTFSAIPDFGVWFMQNSTAADTPQSGTQFYVQTQGLGNDYGYSSYALMTAVARDAALKYTYYRTREATTWGAWSKAAAGYADTAGSATDSTKLPLAGGTLSGNVNFTNLYPSGNTAYGIQGNNGYFDTVNSGDAGDPLELVYVRGTSVKIGTGVNGSKPLYAVGIYDNGNQVLHAGNYTSYPPTSISGLTLTSSANGINPDNVTQNQLGYNTSVSLFGQTDGGLYSSAYSSSWIHQIYGDFRTGQIATRGKNSDTWQAWRTQLDSSNYNSYSPTLTGGSASGTWGITAARANRANGNFYIDDNFGNTVVGVYNASRYQGVFAMGDAYKLPADGTSTAGLYGMAWSHPNAGGAAGNLTDHGLLIINNGVFRCAISNSIVASGNITAFSDERLKKNWRNMPESYVSRLAKVKVGIYDRIDEENGTQVGVSAQSLQAVLPEAVVTANDDIKTLSVNYGGAALASAVELAKDNVELRSRIEKLEALVFSLLNKE